MGGDHLTDEPWSQPGHNKARIVSNYNIKLTGLQTVSLSLSKVSKKNIMGSDSYKARTILAILYHHISRSPYLNGILNTISP